MRRLDYTEFMIAFESHRVFSLRGEPLMVQQLTQQSIRGDKEWRELSGRLRKYVIKEWRIAQRQLDLFQGA